MAPPELISPFEAWESFYLHELSKSLTLISPDYVQSTIREMAVEQALYAQPDILFD